MLAAAETEHRSGEGGEVGEAVGGVRTDAADIADSRVGFTGGVGFRVL